MYEGPSRRPAGDTDAGVATMAADAPTAVRPRLVCFYSKSSGRCRRMEGFLAQVLQRRGNHETFRIHRIDTDQRPELAERFGVGTVPTFLVVEENCVKGRLEDPRGCREIATFLAPWLR
jgi:thiol-disulfide isomerase/thioredoxin